MASIRFGKRSFRLPRSRRLRITLGIVLVLAGGLFGWLPVLGYWMVPLGLIVLSVDFPRVRNWRRKWTVWLLRWWRGSKPEAERNAVLAVEPDPQSPLRDSSIVP